jgi:hypothetical protein
MADVNEQKQRRWERWPFWMKYAPILPVWLWYCLKARSFWFFTASNPTITFGGFEGEGKEEMYRLLPQATYPKTLFIQPGQPFEKVLAAVQQNNFSYPFIVKPDVGMKGLLFRKIDNEEELCGYHQHLPVLYMIQELVDDPLEVSVFYYRHPDQPKGVITGFVQKEVLHVTGNGKSSLRELIEQHPVGRRRIDEMRAKHAAQLSQVLAAGEHYNLAWAANLSRGATFTNLHDQIDDRLLEVFDAISKPAQFYYGRYDLKCRSIEELKESKHFSILEYNGSGAEPNHVYQSGFSWFKALGVFLHHWKALYRISVANHKNGIPYWPFAKGWRFLKQARDHFKLLEELDHKIKA